MSEQKETDSVKADLPGRTEYGIIRSPMQFPVQKQQSVLPVPLPVATGGLSVNRVTY